MTRVQFLAGARMGFFSLPPHLDKLWGPCSLLSNGCEGFYLRGKAAGL